MKIRVKDVGIGLLVFNLGLLLLTFGLSQQAQMQNPMMGELISIGDMKIHVIESKPESYQASNQATYDALVLIHGASTSALDFSTNLLPELSKRYPVVAIDRPGHGYSERGSRPEMDHPSQQANVILDTLSEMQIKRPVLIGHSWAGSVVLAAILAEHKDVEPAAGVLIAGETHPYEFEISRPTELALAPYGGPIFRWQYLTPIGRMAIAPTVEEFLAPDKVPENYVSDTGLYLSLRPTVYLYNALDRTGLSNHLIDLSKQYAEIKTPILSIIASEDRVLLPSDHHHRLVEVLPEVQSSEVVGAGHAPHHTRTDEVIGAIEEFVERLN